MKTMFKNQDILNNVVNSSDSPNIIGSSNKAADIVGNNRLSSLVLQMEKSVIVEVQSEHDEENNNAAVNASAAGAGTQAQQKVSLLSENKTSENHKLGSAAPD